MSGGDLFAGQPAARKKTAGSSGYARLEHDAYFTETWPFELLTRKWRLRGPIWDPACGEGVGVEVLKRARHDVIASDLVDHRYEGAWVQMDFLKADLQTTARGDKPGAIITNPPYKDLAEQFVRRAIDLMHPVGGQVCMLLPIGWACANCRDDLFEPASPFVRKVEFRKRIRWIKDSTGNPRQQHAWFIWDWRAQREQFNQIVWGP